VFQKLKGKESSRSKIGRKKNRKEVPGQRSEENKGKKKNLRSKIGRK